MSTLIPTIDLTGATIGKQYTLNFNQFVKFNPAQMQSKAHIGIFNESGCGLQCVMQASGDAQYLPAGGWVVFEIEPNDGSMLATVTYTLPNPPVSQLNAVYFAPGEQIPPSYTLGNSPIGIGGSVSTSGNSLSNEGSGPNILVIDMGDVAFSDLFTLYNDGHALWAVDQSGVKHQVLKVQASGVPIQIGQAGDTAEFLGDMLVDNGKIGRLAAGDIIDQSSGDYTNFFTPGVDGFGFIANGNLLFNVTGDQFGAALALNSADTFIRTISTPLLYTSGSGVNTLFNARTGGTMHFQINQVDLMTATSTLVSILQALSVTGSSSLDNGKLTTDGSGTVQLSKTSTAINGSVSGNVQFFTPIWGASLKILVIQFNNYNSANAISFTLPSAMARGWIYIGNQGGAAVASHFESGGIAVNVRLLSALGGSVAGSTVQQSNMFQDNIASIISTVDTWKMAATAGATSSAIVCVGA